MLDESANLENNHGFITLSIGLKPFRKARQYHTIVESRVHLCKFLIPF